MNWRSTARKDVRDAIRSRTIRLLLVAFTGLFVLGHVAFGPSGGPFEEFVDRLFADLSWLVPIVAIVLGYKAVLHERESGTLVLALSLPQSRRDFVVGKFVGRWLVAAVPTAAGLLVAGAIAAIRYDSVSPLPYLAFTALTVLFAAAFVSIALACSMSTTASRRVLFGAIGAYVVLDQWWAGLTTYLVEFLYRFDYPADALPDWAVALQLASPSEAYGHLVAALFGFDSSRAHLAAEAPWFSNSWTALLVLLVWIAAPLGVGYLRFGRADL